MIKILDFIVVFIAFIIISLLRLIKLIPQLLEDFIFYVVDKYNETTSKLGVKW